MKSVLKEVLAPVRASMMQAASSAFLQAIQASVSCKIECSACCRRYIVVTLAEALVLIDFLKEHKRWDYVAPIAREQLDLAMGIRPAAWFKSSIRCPLLFEDKCLAYDVRPVSCSSHFALSSPESCSAECTSPEVFVPFDVQDSVFEKTLARVTGQESLLRKKLPMAVALCIGDKMNMSADDFDTALATLSREFGR